MERMEIDGGASQTARTVAPRAACALAARLAASASGIVVTEIAADTRRSARTASARQIGMYLAHTVFGLSLKTVGVYFGRDRTTAAHACRLVEDRRDDRVFDEELAELEDLLRLVGEPQRAGNAQ